MPNGARNAQVYCEWTEGHCCWSMIPVRPCDWTLKREACDGRHIVTRVPWKMGKISGCQGYTSQDQQSSWGTGWCQGRENRRHHVISSAMARLTKTTRWVAGMGSQGAVAVKTTRRVAGMGSEGAVAVKTTRRVASVTARKASAVKSTRSVACQTCGRRATRCCDGDQGYTTRDNRRSHIHATMRNTLIIIGRQGNTSQNNGSCGLIGGWGSANRRRSRARRQSRDCVGFQWSQGYTYRDQMGCRGSDNRRHHRDEIQGQDDEGEEDSEVLWVTLCGMNSLGRLGKEYLLPVVGRPNNNYCLGQAIKRFRRPNAGEHSKAILHSPREMADQKKLEGRRPM